MKILLLSNEYPPHIYGGAGVHVAHLCTELMRIGGDAHRLQVLCFGDQRETGSNVEVRGIADWPMPSYRDGANRKVIDVLGRNIAMAGEAEGADLVHCHTWYTYLAGCLVKHLMGVPLVITVHSLEPLRPWKREQIGAGYNVSSWLEQTALENADGIIAVSQGMKADILRLYDVAPEKVRVVYNGIDAYRYRKVAKPDVLVSYGIDPLKPTVLFVGRITRQKGIIHLVHALPHIEAGAQIVLCAGAPDTREIADEMRAEVEKARAGTPNPIIWIPEMVPVERLIPLYSHAAVFVCPSVYEPFGIINLEAMACGTPVVASAVGGIPEVVLDGETGILVPFEPVGSADPEPRRPEVYARELAAAINDLLRVPEKGLRMGAAGRRRVEALFGWEAIVRQTLAYYRELSDARPLRSDP